MKSIILKYQTISTLPSEMMADFHIPENVFFTKETSDDFYVLY
jgi:hypothetical protein